LVRRANIVDASTSIVYESRFTRQALQDGVI